MLSMRLYLRINLIGSHGSFIMFASHISLVLAHHASTFELLFTLYDVLYVCLLISVYL